MSRSIKKLFRPLYVGGWVDAYLAKNPELQQTDLADSIGISDGYLSELMSGEKKNPSIHVLRAVAKKIGIRLDDFYEKPPADTQLERLKNLSPSDAATLIRLLDDAKSLKKE